MDALAQNIEQLSINTDNSTCIEKCEKCHLEKTSEHDCIAALLAKNNELQRKLDVHDQIAIGKATIHMDKLNLDDCYPKQILCVNGHQELKPNHDCIGELREQWNHALLKIDELSDELIAVKRSLLVMSQTNQQLSGKYDQDVQAPWCNCTDELFEFKRQAMAELAKIKNAINGANKTLKNGQRKNNTQPNNNLSCQPNRQLDGQPKNQPARLIATAIPDDQILADCKRYLSGAPVLLENKMVEIMKNKTISIIVDALAKQKSLVNVCKHVCDQLDLKYGTSWHCIGYASEMGQAHHMTNTCNLIRVKIGSLTLLLYQANAINVSDMLSRIRANKINRQIKPVYKKGMTPKIVTALETITFDAIDRKDNMTDIAKEIAHKMNVRFHSKDWYCVVCVLEYGGDFLKYYSSYIVNEVGQLIIYVGDRHKIIND